MRLKIGRPAATGALGAWGAAAVLFWASTGCEDRGPTAAPPGPGAAAQAAPDATYTTRGRIETMPATAGGGIAIHHEPIPGFRSRSGEVVGMGSMTMHFIPAAGLDLSGLAPGDAVEFTWEVRWNTRPNSRVIRISKLPAGTALNFGAAAPEAPAGPAPSK